MVNKVFHLKYDAFFRFMRCQTNYCQYSFVKYFHELFHENNQLKILRPELLCILVQLPTYVTNTTLWFPRKNVFFFLVWVLNAILPHSPGIGLTVLNVAGASFVGTNALWGLVPCRSGKNEILLKCKVALSCTPLITCHFSVLRPSHLHFSNGECAAPSSFF